MPIGIHMLILNSQRTKYISSMHQGLWVEMKNQKVLAAFHLGKVGVLPNSLQISSWRIEKPEGIPVLNGGARGGDPLWMMCFCGL